MQNLEINKRLCRLVDQRKRLNEKKESSSKLFQGIGHHHNNSVHLAILSKFNINQEAIKNGEPIKFGKKDVHEMLEDFYGERMFKIHKKFPKQFLKALLKGTGAPGDPPRSSSETKKELVELLFDTVFYIVCDVVT